ncbi:hypothetical protein ACWD00_34540 [Streptomyces viridiviolaceus]
MPGIDWEAARGLPKGAPSRLREYAKLAPPRAAVVRAFVQGLADRHGVTVWARNSPYSGRWELDWERIEETPTEETVRRELADDPEAPSYASEIVLCPAWGEITREARELLPPSRAAIVHTGTTDLSGHPGKANRSRHHPPDCHGQAQHRADPRRRPSDAAFITELGQGFSDSVDKGTDQMTPVRMDPYQPRNAVRCSFS